jgi:hypothetical protein
LKNSNFSFFHHIFIYGVYMFASANM